MAKKNRNRQRAETTPTEPGEVGLEPDLITLGAHGEDGPQDAVAAGAAQAQGSSLDRNADTCSSSAHLPTRMRGFHRCGSTS